MLRGRSRRIVVEPIKAPSSKSDPSEASKPGLAKTAAERAKAATPKPATDAKQRT
jgi:hypothetical protein